MKTLEGISARLGFVGKGRERSLLFIGSNVDAIEALSDVFEEVMSRDSRLRIILSSQDSDVRAWARQRFPKFLVVPLPFESQLSAGIYLRQLKIRVVAFVEASGLSVTAPFIAKLEQLAIGVVGVTGRNAETIVRAPSTKNLYQAVVVVRNDADGVALSNGISILTASALTDMFDIMLARDLKALRKPGSFAGLLMSQHWQWAVSWRVTRLANLDALKRRLGSPGTIMCLGNGPSSADPALLDVSYDALFRVNHSWLAKKFMARPDVVFTGGRPTMRALDRVVFGLQNSEAEERLMQTRVFNPLRSHSNFFNAHDVTDALRKFDWGHLRPTNGASMIAAAVALKPKKLVIAGIDLFQHAEGSYPGETSVPNAYAPAHSRETELEFLLKLFSAYDGELVIFGDILRAARDEHCAKSG